MLKHLEINNIALIEKLSVELNDGFNILTGETGAGKSIIIDSINALLGQRTNRELIRSGAESAYVEGMFQIPEGHIEKLLSDYGIEAEEDGTLLLAREIQSTGRNICRINGRMTTVTVLKEIGEHLIDVHGQYDSQSLLRTACHADLLDSFGGNIVQAAKRSYSSCLSEYRETKAKLDKLMKDNAERQGLIDLLSYQINEITSASPAEDEEEELLEKKAILSNAEKIIIALSQAQEALNRENIESVSARDGINEAIANMRAVSGFSDEYMRISSELEEVLYKVEDLISDIRKSREMIDFTPGILDSVEDRLDVIYKLKKKYGSTLKEVMEYGIKAQARLEEVINNEKLTTEIEGNLKILRGKLFESAQVLTAERQRAALALEKNIGTELNDLDMRNSTFKVHMVRTVDSAENLGNEISDNGLDFIEFMISTNPGEPLKPLAKIASGGEMSRIMLAIKKILADADRIPTLIFDEIDMGVGGGTALKIGQKLHFISSGHQVICVTHLAQIACMADCHYYISKTGSGERTVTVVSKLEGEEIVREIARLMGGSDETEISLSHAREILKNAKGLKLKYDKS